MMIIIKMGDETVARGGNKQKLSLKKIVAVVAVCFAVVMFANQFSRINYYNGQIKNLESQIEEQKKIKKELSNRQDVYSSKEYVEKIARDTLGLVRANEKVYIDSNNREN